MPIGFAILLAAAATSLVNFGMALQKRGAAALPKIGEGKGGTVLKAFFSQRLWLSGLGLLLFGWSLYLTSAKFAPISIIQPVMGFGLMVLALFSVFYLHETIRPLEWAAFAAMLGGIILLGLSSEESETPPLPQPLPLLIVTGVILFLSALCYLLGKRDALAGFRTDSLLGIFSGLFVGLAALYIKAMFTYDHHGHHLIAFGLCLPVMVALNVIGITVMQSGFQHGKALVVVSLQSVLNKVVAIIGGMMALDEHLPEDRIKAGMRLLAFLLVLFGSAALARFGGQELAEKMKRA